METKEQMKPSKGPWDALWDADGDHAIYASDGALVAVTGGTWGLAKEEDEANARLISLAPQMLEALKEAVDWIEVLCGEGATNALELRKTENLMAAIHKLIHRAEGL